MAIDSSPPFVEIRPPLRWAHTWLAPVPRERRLRAFALIGLLIAVIGWTDLLAGYWISLQLFYLAPIILAVAWLGWRAGCAISLLCVGVRLSGDASAGIFQAVEALPIFWNRLAEFGTFVVISLVLHAVLSLQREMESRVKQRTASLEQAIAARDQLQRELFDISRRERSAIGHDLHDGLGQHLTATAMAANLLAGRLLAAGQPTAADAQGIVRLLQESITKTRQLARGLLLSAIEPDALAPELEELAENLRQEHRLRCEFTHHGTVQGLAVGVSSQLFYIAQEAARNAARHSGGSRITIDLNCEPIALTITVCDDGKGLPRSVAHHPGMGLRIMRHRSELIGATFSIDPISPGGTRVRCRYPLPSTSK